MLRSVKELDGYMVRATDGDIGQVRDFYFDDQLWTIRYVVVDTGAWLPGRQVLISPLAFNPPEWGNHLIRVALTRSQVKASPPVEKDRPVSRQREEELRSHYEWPPYWGLGTTNEKGTRRAMEIARDAAEPLEEEVHLRSVEEVTGYHVQAIDGDIGHVEDFVVDDETWIIRYVVADTRDLVPGKRVLVAPSWVGGVNWAEREVQIDLHRETIRNSPEFDPSAPVNRQYEARLYDYYGRPKYWA